VLAGFSASLGVSSYRQLQEEVAAAKAAREKALLDVNARVAQLSQQLEYEEREKERRVKEAKDSKNRFKVRFLSLNNAANVTGVGRVGRGIVGDNRS
jgi:hypothetical protein